jgi:hypothetical protein
MYLHHEKKIGFIAHPRTASTATSHALMEMGFEISQGHHEFKRTLDATWIFFCTVRNPLDVMVSWYYNKPREKPFDLWLPEFLEGCHFLQGPRMFFGRHLCSHVLYYETLQEDFDEFCQDVGLPQKEIPKRNVSKRPEQSFRMYYNIHRTRLVINNFREDFVENGYHLPALRGI